MSKPILVIALYKANSGGDRQLRILIKEQFHLLKQYDLTTDRIPFVAKSKNGTYLEVFEWKNAAAAKSAHGHSAIAKIWEAMGMICSFEKLESLPEISKPFPDFELVEI